MLRRADERKALDDEITQIVARRLHKQNSQYLAEENILHYRHGDQWAHIDATARNSDEGTFAELSVEMTLDLRAIVDNDITVIARFVRDMSEGMHTHMARTMFETVGAAAEEIGNVVSVAEKKPDNAVYDKAMQDAFKQMIDKAELAVDKFGAPTYPTMYISPGNQRMIDFISGRKDPTFELEVEQIKAKKETQAVAAEAERLAGFRRK